MTNKQVVTSAIETLINGRDAAAVDRLVSPALRQHAAAIADGLEGLRAWIAALDPTTRFDVHRVLADGDLVVTHASVTDAAGARVAFDVWRVQDGLITEHWDGQEPVATETASGHSQTDGPTTPDQAADTDATRALVETTVQTILVENDFSDLGAYLGDPYVQHNPRFADGIPGLVAALGALAEQGITMSYRARVLTIAEGDFAYTLSDGQFGGTPFAFHDLFRVADGRCAEHWDVMLPQPEASANANGLF